MERERVLLVTNNRLGSGPEELGYILSRGFFRQLLENPDLPGKIIFMNNGVKLLVDEEVVEVLSSLCEKGVELLACGTCLDYFGLLEEMRVGEVSNMKEITRILMGPDEILTL